MRWFVVALAGCTGETPKTEDTADSSSVADSSTTGGITAVYDTAALPPTVDVTGHWEGACATLDPNPGVGVITDWQWTLDLVQIGGSVEGTGQVTLADRADTGTFPFETTFAATAWGRVSADQLRLDHAVGLIRYDEATGDTGAPTYTSYATVDAEWVGVVTGGTWTSALRYYVDYECTLNRI